MYLGKQKTDSNISWHRPMATNWRVDEELMEKSTRGLDSTTDPLDRLRLLCLGKGATGILFLGRIFRRRDSDDSKYLDKDTFYKALHEAGHELSEEDAEDLFKRFTNEENGLFSVDDFMNQFRPAMSEGRRAIVERAFKKLDRNEEGTITVDDLRRIYSVNSNPRYKSGEESKELILNKFLAHFEDEGSLDGKVTLEDFMNYYSGISVSIDTDCYFDLMMRQDYKL